MNDESKSFIRVYCPELQDMIKPGEWAMCPYFRGKTLNLTETNDMIKQIFQCHVQCGCKVEYQYYEKDRLITKTEDSIEDSEILRNILLLVAGKSQEEKRKKRKKILLVDDDADFLEMHSAVLEHKGFKVIGARSSKECLEKLLHNKPDIVVLDVMMEHFDSGFKASAKIKELYPNIPIILLTSIGAQTGMEFSGNEEVLKLTGADVLLDKPVSPKIFIDEIEKLTGKKSN